VGEGGREYKREYKEGNRERKLNKESTTSNREDNITNGNVILASLSFTVMRLPKMTSLNQSRNMR